eukprot:768506-Hanusia_phi.AAC.3
MIIIGSIRTVTRPEWHGPVTGTQGPPGDHAGPGPGPPGPAERDTSEVEVQALHPDAGGSSTIFLFLGLISALLQERLDRSRPSPGGKPGG